MGNTLAIHWSATTHGTWLHGDPRGSWRNGRLIGADPYLEAETRARLASDVVILDKVERELVAHSFGAIVRAQRHRVFAATIRPTHVHLVLAPIREDIKNVIARFKRRSSAAVLEYRREKIRPARMAGLYSRPILRRRVPRSLWTAGRFPVFIFNERHLINAIEYVRDHNRRDGAAADPVDWIEPLYAAPEVGGERLLPHEVCAEPRVY